MTPSPAANGETIEIHDHGLTVPRSLPGTVDVLFDGRRIWSFHAEDFKAAPDGWRQVKWPRNLRRFLRGAATVTLCQHGSQGVIHEEEHVFGGHEGRVRVENARGQPLIIDKWGFASQPLEARPPDARRELLDTAQRIIETVTELAGLPVWLAFGSLLGAVRDGRFIGHDTDIDLAYLSRQHSPASVTLELFHIARILASRGLQTRVRTGGFLTVVTSGSAGSSGSIDLYASFYVGEILYRTSNKGSRISEESILPLGQVQLEGRSFPAPADAALMLSETYGPGWRTPDPGFRYAPSEQLRRRFRSWFGQDVKGEAYWRSFYRDHLGSEVVPDQPSSFAEWVRPQIAGVDCLIDVGCGNGRDTVFLASQASRAVGYDFSRSALHYARRRAEADHSGVEFAHLTLHRYRQLIATAAHEAHEHPGVRVIYARFLLHVLDVDARSNLWRFCDMMLRRGGIAFLEFRTAQDAKRSHHHASSVRRFIKPDRVIGELEAAGGSVVERYEGIGVSPYLGEDPHLCRLKVEWTR